MPYEKVPCAEIETMQRKATILFEPAGWGSPYQTLHAQTDISGYEMFLLEATGNFNNHFAQAMQRVYDKRGFFGLILRDIVRNGGRGTDDRGRLHLKYISHAGTEWEQEHDVWVPKNGWYVPNDDCEKINGIVVPFHPGTIAAVETVPDKKEAVKRFEKHGLDPRYVSCSYRLDKYKDDRFAGRYFCPAFGDGGRFGADLDGLPSDSGDDWVASLPAYREHEIVQRASAVPQEVKAE